VLCTCSAFVVHVSSPSTIIVYRTHTGMVSTSRQTLMPTKNDEVKVTDVV
jgi:hypothetical protein